MAPFRKHKTTVVLIDDHPGTLRAACELLKDEFSIVATVINGEAGLDIVSMFHPDVVVLDIGLPGRDGFETARRLKALGRGPKIVFLTVMEGLDYACAARDMGNGYVVKRRMRTDLVPAVRDAMVGNVFLSPILPTESSEETRRVRHLHLI